MEYIATISPQGTTILYETSDIKQIHLMQQVQFKDKEGIYYLVVIEYTDRDREQTVISNEVWQAWNDFQSSKGTNEN